MQQQVFGDETESVVDEVEEVAEHEEPTPPPESPPDGHDVYERLAAPFEFTFHDVRGGVDLTYITGEQVATRLNQVLGVAGWSFRVLRHDINVEADEAWALGEIAANIDGQRVIRQQFGSQKLKRSRSTGTPLDIGFDLKGATTDAMKKCASLLGVGLYLSAKPAPAAAPAARRTQPPARTNDSRKPNWPPPANNSLVCEKCRVVLQGHEFADGTAWTAKELSERSRSKFRQVLCFACYKQAAQATAQSPASTAS